MQRGLCDEVGVTGARDYGRLRIFVYVGVICAGRVYIGFMQDSKGFLLDYIGFIGFCNICVHL